MRYVNRIATSCFDTVFSVMESWPGILSLTVLAAATAVLAMLAYRYTSNQAAIGRVHDEIKANLLAIKLFRDELSVTFRAQGRLLWAAARVFLYSLQPLAVMIVPIVLLICQMAQRYENRAFRPGETALLTVELLAGTPEDIDPVLLTASEGVTVEAGPLRLYQRQTRRRAETNRVVWRLRPATTGHHLLNITIGEEKIAKEMMVSEELYARVSPKRPGNSFWDKLLYPVEEPAQAGAIVQEVELDFPPNRTPILGLNLWPFRYLEMWLVTYFVISMVLGLILMPVFKVKMW